MHLQEKEFQTALGIYCHVPFCASTCDFCAFYQEKPRRRDLDRYLNAMDLELGHLPQDRVVETVFWGGGTPGLLAARDLERLGQSLLDRLVQPPKEWTVEMAPSTVKEDKLKVLKDLGVTRISMGVQSFDTELLESLGRLHRPNQIYKAWELVQAVDFSQTNIDLMFAIPNQSILQWEAAIREAVQLGPGHISTYCLTFEEDTALYVKLSEGKVRIDEEREIKFYKRGWKLLEELGYRQYEISNFENSGKQCVHNLNTWHMMEWIGCGPSAASQYQGERYRNPSNLDEWCTAIESGNSLKNELVKLNDRILFSDAVLFGLRMNEGIDLKELQRRYPSVDGISLLQSLWDRLKAQALLEYQDSRIKLNRDGRLLCDTIGSLILEAFAG